MYTCTQCHFDVDYCQCPEKVLQELAETRVVEIAEEALDPKLEPALPSAS